MQNYNIEVRLSAIHNTGVFAAAHIPKDTPLIEYVGEKVSMEECRRREAESLARHKEDGSKGSTYMFILDDDWAIDGEVEYNVARWINHSCEPNAEIDIIDGRIWIISKQDIKKGEEITYNYGFDMDNYEEYPCRCGKKGCVGYILDEEHWDKIRDTK